MHLTHAPWCILSVSCDPFNAQARFMINTIVKTIIKVAIKMTFTVDS